jgi:hypothetical protein
MKCPSSVLLAVVFFSITGCLLADQPLGASPSPTPIGPPNIKEGYLLSLQDRAVEQSRRIRIAERSGALTKDQARDLRGKIHAFLSQIPADVMNKNNEPSPDVKKSRYEQITTIAREIDSSIAQSKGPPASATPAVK